MAIIRDIYLNVFPSDVESPNNNNQEFFRNNLDLNR